ncbi:MAG TPA: hypothetical protein VFG30_08135 [Polyangiales bacterium]|nr:hypothetical protein [Polyangiales bacterium]
MTRHLRWVGLWTLLVCAPVAAQSASEQKTLARASDLIEALHVSEGEQLLASLPSSPQVLYQRALAAFYHGDYASSVSFMDEAVSGLGHGRAPKPWLSTRELVQATRELTQDYQSATSPDGRFVVLFPRGEDAVLVPYALDVLASMDRTLAGILGTSVPGPIRLEVYASAAALAQVSTLTLEQIETSGTVALCKWNRLMITSPRALVRGYPWADTIAHELTHLYLSYVTEEKAPVWLQEGTAKLLERRWRKTGGEFELDPTSRGLLERATRDGKLLGFEQLHPSIALLPSQDDATLAFAQVSTFMNSFVAAHGELALRHGFANVRAGQDARDALAQASGGSFGDLERSWRAGLPRTREEPAPRKLARRFRATQTDAPDESQDVAASEARRHLRLGDLLFGRRRVRGAMFEYEKAQHADADDPIVAARLARAALEAGDPARSLAAVEPLLLRYPEHAPTHAVRGAALAELGRSDEARTALMEAIRINPFDPDPHCRLARIAQSSGDQRIEREACDTLRGL